MTDTSNLKQRFIQAMRTVSCSVSVITTAGKYGLHGATASSFCSVSADPPSILVCLLSVSGIAKAVAGNKKFSLNILKDDQQHLSNRFAGRDDEKLTNRFDGLNYEMDNGVPTFANATNFICQKQQIIQSGSHDIIIGLVSSVKIGTDQPLTYLDGKYRSYSNKID